MAVFYRFIHFRSVCCVCNMLWMPIKDDTVAENWHTHTHPFNGPLSGTTQVSRYQKGKTSVDFSEARDSEWHGISWTICKSAPSSRQITMPAPYHSVSYRLDALPAAQPTASMHWRQLKTEPVVKHKHIGMKPGICILFVFDLDGECKFIKKKTL